MHYREAAFAAQTAEHRMKAMAEQLDKARADFDEALKLRPKYVAVRRRLLQSANLLGLKAGQREQLDKALEVCPQSYILRAHYIEALTPRWGGSVAQMRAYVKDTAPLVAGNPKLALLEGFIAADQCKTAREAERLRAAHVACDAALRHGDEPAFLLAKVDVHLKDRSFAAALPLLDRALAIAPHDRAALNKRFATHVHLKHTLLAATDLIAYRHLSPSGGTTAGKVDRTVAKLRFEGQELHDAGDYVEAAKYFALGLQLAPDDADMANREAWNQKSIGLEDAQAQLAAAPDDYALHLRIDHGLAASRRFAEVVKIWDTFIEAHPEDPRPYVERGGAKWHLGQQREAIADMKFACRLGMQSACADVPKMQARAR